MFKNCLTHPGRQLTTLLILLSVLLTVSLSPISLSYAQNSNSLVSQLSDPRGALYFRHLQLQDEHGVIPPHAYANANAQVARMRAAQAKTTRPLAGGITPGSWTPLGPGNIGGRIRSIIPIDANTIFIGSVGGGIWKTTNGGTSWLPVNDFMADLAIASMVIDPTNSSVMYAGTGEGFGNYDAIQGAGIFKSTDGGTAWNQLPSTNNSDFNFVNRLAISPDDATLLAATGSGIWRSTDGGTNWTQETFSGVLQVAFHPTDSTRAVAGTSFNALYSTDGGLTWNSATGLPGGRAEVAYAPSSPTIVYASVDNNQGEFYRSTDGGQSYSAVNTGNNLLGGQAWYNNVLWVDPTNANTVVIGGTPLWRSTNGGTAFTNITGIHADQHVIVAAPGFDGTTNTRVYVGNDGGVFTTANIYTATSSSGWVNLNNNLAITQFLSAAGNASSGVIIGGAQDNGVDRFDGNLADTNSWTFMAGGDGGFTAADQTDANYFYSEYTRLRIERSTDAGGSSSYIYTGITDAGSNANFIAPFILDPNNVNTMLAGGQSLWRSTNVKAATPSWSIIKPSVAICCISAIAVATGNSDIIWVGYNDGEIDMTTNGTSASPTWTRVDNNTPPLPKRMVQRIAIDPSDSNIVYATFGGFNSDNVWRTTDGGTNWSQRVGFGVHQLPAAPVFSLAIHPSNSAWIYAATEVGIFASEDAGNTWNLPQDGPANVSTDELQWMNNTLLAATHGRGSYKVTINAPTGGDISVTKTGAATAIAGTDVSYNITVANGGPGDASIVTLTDNTPPNTTFVSMTQSTGPTFFCSTPSVGGTGTVSCYIPTFTNGSTATFTLVVHLSPSASGTLSNTTNVSSSTPDANSGNNSSTLASIVITSADLSVTKSQTSNLVIADINETYTLTVTNNGPSDAQNVSLIDATPTNTTFKALSQTSGTAFTCVTPPSGGTGAVSCTLTTLPVGASATFTMAVRISPVDTSAITNTASIAANTSDPNLGNNTSTVSATVSVNNYKQSVLADLTILLGTTTNQQDRHKLHEAIEHLADSLERRSWTDDNTLVVKEGNEVFTEEKAAVSILSALIKHNNSGISGAVQGLVDRLIAADHALADIAITQAISAGGRPNQITQAQNQLAQGDNSASAGKYAVAINHYKNAWRHAQAAMKTREIIAILFDL